MTETTTELRGLRWPTEKAAPGVPQQLIGWWDGSHAAPRDVLICSVDVDPPRAIEKAAPTMELAGRRRKRRRVPS